MGTLDYLTLGNKIPLRVAAYCRISFDEAQNGSFDTQRNFFKNAINEHPGWQSSGVFSDFARTGTQIRGRTDFQRMIRHAEEGYIDYIITKSISRFSRSASDTLKTLQKLDQLNVGVYFMEQGLDTASKMGVLVLSALSSIAEMESASISDNVLMTFNSMNEKGTPLRRCSYGYRREGTEWVIEPCKAIRIKLAYLMAANGFTFTEIANRLNDFEQIDRSGRKWTVNTVKYALLSETYKGDILTNKHTNIRVKDGRKEVKNNRIVDQFYIDQHHDAIVGKPLWTAVTDMLKAKELAGQAHFHGTDHARVLARRDHLLDDVRKYMPKKKPTA